MDQPETAMFVKKSDVTYLEMTVDRRGAGLEIWIKADPAVEEFMKALYPNTEKGTETLERYGRSWFPTKNGAPLYLYKLEKDMNGRDYTINAVCGGLTGKGEMINLSFLRFVGISGPDGITFNVQGPFSKDFSREWAGDVKGAVGQFVRDYIVPVHIEIRISSKEY